MLGRIAKRIQVIFFLVMVLSLLQVGMWLFHGRTSLDDQAFMHSLEEFLDVIKSGSEPDPKPDFFFVGIELEASLSKATLGRSRQLLSSAGIKMLFDKDLNADRTVPKEGAVSSRFYVNIRWNTPVFATVDFEDGYGPGWVVPENTTRELHLFVFGKWFCVKRSESYPIVW